MSFSCIGSCFHLVWLWRQFLETHLFMRGNYLFAPVLHVFSRKLRWGKEVTKQVTMKTPIQKTPQQSLDALGCLLKEKTHDYSSKTINQTIMKCWGWKKQGFKVRFAIHKIPLDPCPNMMLLSSSPPHCHRKCFRHIFMQVTCKLVGHVLQQKDHWGAWWNCIDHGAIQNLGVQTHN